MRDRAEAEALARLVGLSPETLLPILVPSANSHPTQRPVVARMGRLVDFVPLSERELEVLNSVFTVAAQATVPGSVILDGLLRMALGGSTWDQVGTAARMRLRRGARRREFEKLSAFVASQPDVFDPQRIALFARVAEMEAAIRRRTRRL